MANLIYAKEQVEDGLIFYWIVDEPFFKANGCARDVDYCFKEIPDCFVEAMESAWEYCEFDELAEEKLKNAGIKYSPELQELF